MPDADVAAAALTRAFERAGLKPPRRAALVVPDSVARVSLLSFETLPSHAADLDQLVRWQLRKSTPFPIDDAQVSHAVAQSADGRRRSWPWSRAATSSPSTRPWRRGSASTPASSIWRAST